MSKLFIPLILGTGREGRQSEHVAKFVFELLKKNDRVETQFIDVRDFAYPVTQVDTEACKPWLEIASRADGFFIVSPEYNHGYPGELKMLLDQGDEEYDGKPVAMCGVSSGGLGGARMVEALLPVFRTLGFWAIAETLYVSSVEKTFVNGVLQDESYIKKAEKVIDALIEKAEQLKVVREK